MADVVQAARQGRVPAHRPPPPPGASRRRADAINDFVRWQAVSRLCSFHGWRGCQPRAAGIDACPRSIRGMACGALWPFVITPPCPTHAARSLAAVHRAGRGPGPAAAAGGRGAGAGRARHLPLPVGRRRQVRRARPGGEWREGTVVPRRCWGWWQLNSWVSHVLKRVRIQPSTAPLPIPTCRCLRLVPTPAAACGAA